MTRAHRRTPTLSSILAPTLVVGLLLASCGKPPVNKEAVPSWVPAYPGSQASLATSSDTEEGWAGTAFVSLDLPGVQASEFYRDELEGAGFKVRYTPGEANSEGIAQIVAHTPNEARGLTITVTADGDTSHVVINFTESI